jgi:hypothetical protein
MDSPRAFGGLPVRHELELGGLLDGQVRWLGTVEDLVDLRRRASARVGAIHAVIDERPGVDDLPVRCLKRQPMLERDLGDPRGVDAEERVGQGDHAPPGSGGGLKGGLQIHEGLHLDVLKWTY